MFRLTIYVDCRKSYIFGKKLKIAHLWNTQKHRKIRLVRLR